MPRESGEKLITVNRKARHDYFIDETVEAGLVLVGTEVKSLREVRVNLRDAYAELRRDELYLVNAHISVYEQGNIWNHEPLRPRKLLLHRREIERLNASVREKGLTVVPTRLYFKDGRVKVEIALARGKDLYDKRQSIRERETKRDMERAVREARR